MNSLMYIAHANHVQQSAGAGLKGYDAVMVTAMAIVIVTAFVIWFYSIGPPPNSAHESVSHKERNPKL